MKNLKCNLNLMSSYIITMIIMLLSISSNAQPPIAVPDGYAASQGTTGGGNATPVTVSSAEAFKSAISGSNPAVIYVNGMLNVGNVSIGSNKTVVGMNASSGLTGGTVRLTGSNYIIQNLSFGPASGDVFEVSGGTKAFITKCSFRDCGDELLSIVRQADFVTVSWCKFFFSDSHSHAFGSLIGNGDGVTADRGKLHVTMHHNWYSNGVQGRMPRVRFGRVHIYNNFFNSPGNGYCIGIGVECHIKLENSHFESVNSPWADYGGTSNGEIGWSNLKFVNSSQPTFMPNRYPVFSVPYSYSLDPVDNVKAIVTAGAGNVFGGGSNNNSPNVSISSPANGATFTAPASITITAAASDNDGNVTNVQFYQGSTLLGSDATSPYSFTWNNVPAGNYSITARATDDDGASSSSPAVNITVRQDGDPLQGYAFCSNEGQTCTFSGSVNIAYGANGQYKFLYNISSGSVGCNNTTFGDPISGVVKACYVQQVSTTTYTLTTSVNGQGSVSPTGGTYNSGTVVSLTATPASGWQFSNWSGGASGSSNPLSVTMNANKSITANFTQVPLANAITIQENQAGLCSYNGTIDTNNTGYTGAGFINTPNSTGQGITWSINAPTTGTYSLMWRYANGTTSNRSGQVLVDGSVAVSSVSFGGTGSWSTWVTTPSVNITLAAGTHTIRLQATNSGGLANIDYITVTGTTPSPGNCNSSARIAVSTANFIDLSEEETNVNSRGLELYPNPAKETLNIKLTERFAGGAVFQMYDNTGRLLRTNKLKGSVHKVDVKDLQSGLYIIKISNNTGMVMKRFTK